MKTDKQIPSTIFLAIVYFVLIPDTSLNHIPVAYSHNQSSSFQAEVKALDDMPSQKATIGDVEIAYKQLGESGAKPIVLITGLGSTMDMWSPF